MSLSVVIPVYRAELTLRDLYHQIAALPASKTGTLEVIFVEDCGGDKSWEIIEELAANDSRIRGIKLSKNYGQHNALLCGIRAARHDVIVTLDDDLQNPVHEIQKLLATLADGYDVVYGVPLRTEHGFVRGLATQLTKWSLQVVLGTTNVRNVSAFRAFHTRLRDSFSDYRSPAVSIDVLLAWGTSNFGSIKVEHAPRVAGESGYTVYKLVTHAFNLLTGFSTLPLRIASMLGFIFTFFGFTILAWVLGRYFLSDGDAVPGFPFLASIIAIFSGVQLFALGIIGEYLARMHFRTMAQPPYLIRMQVESQAKNSE
jgi:glycosyltransferase involved in cell wall biosynthesis